MLPRCRARPEDKQQARWRRCQARWFGLCLPEAFGYFLVQAPNQPDDKAVCQGLRAINSLYLSVSGVCFH